MNYMNSFKFVNLIFTKQFTLVKDTMMLLAPYTYFTVFV